MGIRVTPAKLPEALRRRARATPEVVRDALFIAAQRGRSLLVRKSPVDRGNFKNAWQVHRRQDGADLENSAPYAGIIELGARPHPVSLEGRVAIYNWVARHFPGSDPDELQSITNAIAWKIRRKGQKATYMVRDSMADLRRFMHSEVVRQLKKHARDRNP